MIACPALWLALCVVQVPQNPTASITVGRELRSDVPLDQQILALQKASRWGDLADLFETLDPKNRGQRLGIWLEAMKKGQRWARLEAVLDAAIPQMEAKGVPAFPERMLHATAIERQGRKLEAMRVFLEAGGLGSPLALLQAGNLAVSLGNDEYLGQAAQALTDRFPNLAQGWAWKGETLFRKGQFPEAEPLFEKASSMDAKEPATWTNLGACRNARKAYLEALDACDRAIALDPGFVEAHFNRGLANIGLKRYPEGRSDMQKALDANPADPVMRMRIEENLRMAARYSQNPAGKPAPARPR